MLLIPATVKRSVLYGNGVAKVGITSYTTCLWDEAITDVKELRLTCPRAHKPRVDSSVAFLLMHLTTRLAFDA